MTDQRCRHFTGIHNQRCKLDITYDTVKIEGTRPHPWPCINLELNNCTSRNLYTTDELAQQQKEIDTLVAQVLERLTTGLCIECGLPVNKMRQVGRSIYAIPCGHRNGQGNAKLWQQQQDERKQAQPQE